MIAPVPRARTSAPTTFGLEVTRASVVSRSALLSDGADMDMAIIPRVRKRGREFQGLKLVARDDLERPRSSRQRPFTTGG